MKSADRDVPEDDDDVTPLAGVWIEIPPGGPGRNRSRVTPLAGVWIEISRRSDRT